VAALCGLSEAKVFGAYLDRCDTMFDFEWGGFGGVSKFRRWLLRRVRAAG
jgi:hypothetical protein